MGIQPGTRFVAHYDMLGMSTLVQRHFHKAWGAMRQLDEDREQILAWVIEVADQEHTNILPRKQYIRGRLKSFTFSDTIVIYSAADEEADLRAIIYLCNQIFAQAVHRRIPLREGIAHGTFTLHPERNFGPPLVEAYRLGEGAQWLGTVIDEYTAQRAKEVDLKAATGDPLIVSWRIQLRAGATDIRGVINWPASHRNNFTMSLPLELAM